MAGRRATTLTGRNPDSGNRRRVDADLPAIIGVLTLLAAALRAARLDHPARYDEAFSFLMYASGDGPSAWLAYTYPNNHLLHTLLVHLSTKVAGPELGALRTPAFLAGVLLVPLAALTAYRLSGRRTDAVFAALMVGASSLLVEYSVNARGYSMVCAATLVIALATLAIVRGNERWEPWVVWILAAVAGLFTIPVMLYPIALFALIIVGGTLLGQLPAKRVLIRLGAALVICALLTTLCYLPSVSITGLESVISNRFVQPLPASDVVYGVPGAILLTASQWSRDLGAFVLLVVLGLGMCTAVGVRRRDPFLMLPVLAPTMLVAAAGIQRVVPFPRMWLFLLPVLLICAAVGLGEILARTNRRRTVAITIVGLVVATVVSEGSRVLARDYLISEEPRTLVDAEAIVRELGTMNDGATALAYEIPSGPSLAYYNLLQNSRPWLAPEDPRARRTILVKSHGQTIEEVIVAAPGLAPRIASLTPLRSYPRAEVWEALHKPVFAIDR